MACNGKYVFEFPGPTGTVPAPAWKRHSNSCIHVAGCASPPLPSGDPGFDGARIELKCGGAKVAQFSFTTVIVGGVQRKQVKVKWR